MTESEMRMKAVVAQALAEAMYSRPVEVHVVAYGDFPHSQAEQLFRRASQGTPAESARLVIEHSGSRYICWNCCGLRYESRDGVCPNCGEATFKVPEEAAFRLRRVVVAR
jgi:Zn finger protein HypA/HybF involved in hydrogenase expression